MEHIWSLTKFRLVLAARNRAFFFFGVIIPVLFLFFFAVIFARHGGPAVAYVLASVLAMTVMGSFWGLSMQLVMFREQGILRRFRLTPVGPLAMLVSSVLANIVLTFPAIVIELGLARWVLHMDRWGNLLTVFVLSALGSVTFASLGLVVASVANSMMETQVINQLLWLTFLLLSGVAVPLPNLPDFLQHVAWFLPATYLVTGFQHALLSSAEVTQVPAELASLIVSGVVALFISSKMFRWEPEEKMPPRAKIWVAAALLPALLLGAVEMAYGRRGAEARQAYQSVQEPKAPPPCPCPR